MRARAAHGIDRSTVTRQQHVLCSCLHPEHSIHGDIIDGSDVVFM
jgi:hypothetical protein